MLALDRARPRATRSAAICALGDLRSSTVAPLFAALGRDPDPEIAALATSSGTQAGDPAAWLAKTVQGALPDDPARIREPLPARSGRGGCRCRACTPSCSASGNAKRPSPPPVARSGRRHERPRTWPSRRAAAALRSTICGRRSKAPRSRCPLNSSRSSPTSGTRPASRRSPPRMRRRRSKRGKFDSWRNTLADAFRAIVGREKITKRNAVMKKIEKAVFQASLAGLGFRA